MNHRFSSYYSGQLKSLNVFCDKKSILLNNIQLFEPKPELSCSEVYYKAKESLLNMEYSELYEIQNPEINLIRFTVKDLKANSSQNQINRLSFSLINNNEYKILLKRSKVKNKNAPANHRYIISKNIFPIKKATFHDYRNYSTDKKTVKDSPLIQLSRIAVRPNSNLLTPRSSLPPIIFNENQTNQLKKRARSSLKPYSLYKMHQNIRVMSVIKFRYDITLLPKIYKEHNKKKILKI